MKLIEIKASGSTHMMMWGLKNGADIMNDVQFQSLVNDEMFYLVTLDDINLLQLFRLTQTYREKIKIVEEELAEVPSDEVLKSLFPGKYAPNQDKPNEVVDIYELAKDAANGFMNIVMQMNADDDIIRRDAIRLFIPMLCRKFKVQIPVSIFDILSGVDQNDVDTVFGDNYPESLYEYALKDTSGIQVVISMIVARSTAMIRYEPHYEQLMNMTKFNSLKKAESDSLYKIRLIGFYKYNNITRGQVRCELFNATKDSIVANMKLLATLRTPLRVEFAIQLPIQYMQILESSYSNEELEINYRSSILDIIDNGSSFKDFTTHEFEDNPDDEKSVFINDYKNSIELYQTRIDEAELAVLNTIGIYANNQDVDDPDTGFTLLPSIYSAKAVVTVKREYSEMYNDHYDPTIASMLIDMMEMCSSLEDDISKYHPFYKEKEEPEENEDESEDESEEELEPIDDGEECEYSVYKTIIDSEDPDNPIEIHKCRLAMDDPNVHPEDRDCNFDPVTKTCRYRKAK